MALLIDQANPEAALQRLKADLVPPNQTVLATNGPRARTVAAANHGRRKRFK